MKKTMMILAALTCCFAACHKTGVVPAEEWGIIDLNLSSDGEYAVKAASAITEEQKNEYKISIYSGETLVYGPAAVAEFESSVRKFAAGTYSVTVENATARESEQNPADNSSYGCARISGSNNVTVSAAVNPVTVACTPKNSKVTLVKGAGFDSVFESISITLSCGSDLTPLRSVTYILDSDVHSSAKEAYFQPGILTCSITATTTPAYGSVTKNFGSTFTLEAAQWSKITLSATAEGSASVDVTVDTEYTEKDESVVINPYE